MTLDLPIQGLVEGKLLVLLLLSQETHRVAASPTPWKTCYIHFWYNGGAIVVNSFQIRSPPCKDTASSSTATTNSSFKQQATWLVLAKELVPDPDPEW